MSELLPTIRSQFGKLKVCFPSSNVYNDECVVSFDNPYSDRGLFVNMISLQGFGADYYLNDSSKTGCKLYVHEKWTKVPKPVENQSPEAAAPSKLAIGIEGGFNLDDKWDVVKESKLVVVTNSGPVFVELTDPELPEFVVNVANSIIEHVGMKSQTDVQTWESTNERPISRYADSLVQMPNPHKISSDASSWKCEMSGDTNNLWLNLSTGYIGGGRKNWDGSGGSGAALEHYQQTGSQFPLCVKLGTITASGGDVWSYAPEEDCLVTDPHLADHLSYWGIDIMKLSKTEKSMSEMEVDLNYSYDWSRIIDASGEAKRVHSVGHIGFTNIGSSCYMNSVLQLLVHLPEVQERYLNQRPVILSSLPSSTLPSQDIGVQFSKLLHAEFTSTYLPPAPALGDKADAEASNKEDEPSIDSEKYLIAPRMLKSVVASGHAEFSSARQQDASEYWMHLLQVLSRAERVLLPRLNDTQRPTLSLFEFQVETKYTCTVTNQVNFQIGGQQSLANTLELRIPLDAAVNKEEVESCQAAKKARTESNNPTLKQEEDDVKLRIPFVACLDTFMGNETIEYTNPSLHQVVPTIRTHRLTSFPTYLLVKLGRYYVGENWVQVKVDAAVPMPVDLDLSQYKGLGPQPGEVLMSDAAGESGSSGSNSSSSATPAATVPDENLVSMLMSMGFSENGCKRAAVATNNTSDVEVAMNWILEHMEDANFNDPFDQNASAAAPAADNSSQMHVSAESVEMIASMGYSPDQAKAALMATDNNLERAVDWIFAHLDDLDAACQSVTNTASSSSSSSLATGGGEDPFAADKNASGQYKLIGVVSHMGKNTAFGHYVAHLCDTETNEWFLFNDDKVSTCSKPPLEFGFMYLYKRLD